VCSQHANTGLRAPHSSGKTPRRACGGKPKQKNTKQKSWEITGAEEQKRDFDEVFPFTT